VTYGVASGDTLISIAVHFGISLQALEAANPGIQERFLRIGQQLLIPLPTTSAAAAPTPTPMPLDLSVGRCYPAPTGATWCLADVHNPGTGPLEDVTVQFTLYNDANRAVGEEVESVPLGLLPAGGSLPVAAFFSPLEKPGLRAQVSLVEDVASENPQQRYLPIELVGSQSSPLQGGLELSGQARLSPAASASAAHITVLLVLYDSAGNSIGLRVLQLDETWAPGQIHSFTLRAYSLAGPFSHYAVFLEARP
jgi:murein DD-endopeptidase MepM/ murein hydrolase activator NlpD